MWFLIFSLSISECCAGFYNLPPPNFFFIVIFGVIPFLVLLPPVLKHSNTFLGAKKLIPHLELALEVV